jgi:hypothetical protein
VLRVLRSMLTAAWYNRIRMANRTDSETQITSISRRPTFMPSHLVMNLSHAAKSAQVSARYRFRTRKDDFKVMSQPSRLTLYSVIASVHFPSKTRFIVTSDQPSGL